MIPKDIFLRSLKVPYFIILFYIDFDQLSCWAFLPIIAQSTSVPLAQSRPHKVQTNFAPVMARSMSFLPMVLLALGAWMLSSLTSQSGFVMNSATPRTSKVAMRGFKDDFYAWKETLSSEDQALLLKQAQNESWQKGVGMLDAD